VKLQKKHFLIVLAGAIVIYLIINGIYNYFLSEEQKIKNLFYEMASDIEEKSVLGFGSYFTKDATIRYHEFEMTPREIGLDGKWKIYDATGREHKRPKLIY
jgi:hypothetical protein